MNTQTILEPVFLPERLLESCDDDTELVQQVIEDFQTSGPRCLSRLSEALYVGDSPAVRLQAHSLKGICLTIGAVALAGTASSLEAGAKVGDLSGTPAMLSAAEQQLADLASRLSGYLASEIGRGDRDLDPRRKGARIQGRSHGA